MIQQKPKFERSLFLSGPVNSGKTTAAATTMKEIVLEAGASNEALLIIVPQISMGQPYHEAFEATHDHSYVSPFITTHGMLARQMLIQFWLTMTAERQLDLPESPTFLDFETAQYFMGQLAVPVIETGVFDSLSLPNHRLIAQIVDHLGKTILAGLTLEEAEQRLRNAMGNRIIDIARGRVQSNDKNCPEIRAILREAWVTGLCPPNQDF